MKPILLKIMAQIIQTGMSAIDIVVLSILYGPCATMQVLRLILLLTMLITHVMLFKGFQKFIDYNKFQSYVIEYTLCGVFFIGLVSLLNFNGDYSKCDVDLWLFMGITFIVSLLLLLTLGDLYAKKQFRTRPNLDYGSIPKV